MKNIICSFLLLLPLSTPAFAITPVQFPDQRFPDQRFAQDPFAAIERQQITQETLLILRDTLNVLRETKGIGAEEIRRIEDLSARLDFLISRQQELAMRERLGR